MPDLVLHTSTKSQIESYLSRPTHAVLISGPLGSGKKSIANYLAASILDKTQAAIDEYPYLWRIGRHAETSIPIESIRELSSFLSRRVPGNGKRTIIIEQADKLTTEAQNALLKTLEEPPAGTTLLLVASNQQYLLPTILSRVSRLSVARPSAKQLKEHFTGQGFSEQQVQQVYLISGGLPGLMHALLHNETEHPLVNAVAVARELIQKSSFERLGMVDGLAKDKDLSLQVLGLLQQMAHVALLQRTSSVNWQRIMTQCYEASTLLQASAQPKLVLTNLMLHI